MSGSVARLAIAVVAPTTGTPLGSLWAETKNGLKCALYSSSGEQRQKTRCKSAGQRIEVLRLLGGFNLKRTFEAVF